MNAQRDKTNLCKGCAQALLAAVVAILAAIPLPGYSQLPETVLRLLQERNIPVDSVAAFAVDASGKVLIDHRSAVPMTPASTMKVVTAIVGLDHLGPAWRGRAELRTHAPIVDGVLQGDLILRGVGSVDLDWEPFGRMVESLRAQGIDSIHGNLIIDRTFFQPSRPDLGYPRFDESVEFRYNVIPDALLLNHNLQQYTLESDAEGVRVQALPLLDGVKTVSAFRLIDAPCARWEEGWQVPAVQHADDGSVTVTLRGTFPMRCKATTEINVLDRVLFAERLFRALFKARGGRWEGMAMDSALKVTSGARLLAEHRSRPLSEWVREINKRSDNAYTRVLFLTLGEVPAASATGEPPTLLEASPDADGSSALRADRVVREWMRARSIPDEGLVLDNGSGLSRIEKISPRQLVAVMQAARRSMWAPEWEASLPIVAVDGTMRNRLKATAVAGRARIKTGTLRNVVAVAGTTRRDHGDIVTVAAMINHDNAKSAVARPIVDALLLALMP